MRSRLALILASVVTMNMGCPAGGTDTYRAYIAPLDGQASVSSTLPLMVEVGDISMPADLPIPEGFIQVIDMIEGGTVNGELVREGTRIYFQPSQPWNVDGRYAWTVLPLQRHPHGPQFNFPSHLLGTAVFSTNTSLEMLAAGIDIFEDRTCMVFSRMLTNEDLGAIAVSVNDVPIEDAIISILEPGDWGLAYPIDEEDEGVSVACLTSSVDISVGARMRVWMNAKGPWTTFLEERTSSEIMIDLRRANY